MVVHVVSNENLQVKGELSEYNLANLSVGQEVTFTSKVYQDKSWTGKISYISDYPKNNGEVDLLPQPGIGEQGCPQARPVDGAIRALVAGPECGMQRLPARLSLFQKIPAAVVHIDKRRYSDRKSVV